METITSAVTAIIVTIFLSVVGMLVGLWRQNVLLKHDTKVREQDVQLQQEKMVREKRFKEFEFELKERELSHAEHVLEFQRVQSYRTTERSRHLIILDELKKILEPVFATCNLDLLTMPIEGEPAYKFQQQAPNGVSSTNIVALALKGLGEDCNVINAKSNKPKDTRYGLTLFSKLQELQYSFKQDLPSMEGSYKALLDLVDDVLSQKLDAAVRAFFPDSKIPKDQTEMELLYGLKNARDKFEQLKCEISNFIGQNSRENI